MAGQYRSDELPQDPAVFEAATDPKLERRLKALKARQAEVQERAALQEGDRKIAPAVAAVLMIRILRRIKAVEEQLAAHAAQQEQGWNRARGLLPYQPGTGPEARVTQIVTYSRKKRVPHLDFHIVHKATPSTSTPIRSEKESRRLRWLYESTFGKLSGRQWVKIRKELKRGMRADKREAEREQAEAAVKEGA